MFLRWMLILLTGDLSTRWFNCKPKNKNNSQVLYLNLKVFEANMVSEFACWLIGSRLKPKTTVYVDMSGFPQNESF